MSDDNGLGLLSFMDALHEKVDMSEFDKRLFLQKVVYLGQEVGIPFGYRFGWYIHGPYSPTLTKDAFELESLVKSANVCEVDLPRSSLDADKIDIVKGIIDDVGQRSEGRELWLELLASAHFLSKYAYPRPESNEETLKRLIESKSIDPLVGKEVFRILQKHNLL